MTGLKKRLSNTEIELMSKNKMTKFDLILFFGVLKNKYQKLAFFINKKKLNLNNKTRKHTNLSIFRSFFEPATFDFFFLFI